MNVNIPITNVPRVVIIGCGFAGLKLAKKLKDANVQIVMVDKNNYHNFQPLLYQVATAGLEPNSIAYPIRKIFAGQKNFIFRLAEVQHVDTDKNEVYTNIGPIAYDYLVLATGSLTNFFGIKSIEEKAMQIKSIPSALNLRSLFFQNFEKALLMNTTIEKEELMNIVVVGGGPTGVEVSGALAEMRNHVLPKDYPELDFRTMKIHLIEAFPGLLNGMSKESSDKAREYLEEMGVHVWLNSAVERYENGKVIFGKGKSIHAETLIWAAGVNGASVDGIKAEAISRNRRILVNMYNQVEGYDCIFAIGDVAMMVSEANPKGHPMVAQVAIQQAKLLAKNLKRHLAKQKMEPFVYNDKGSMATVGRNRAVVDLPKFKFQGIFAWFVWMFVHLMTLVGFRNKVVTLVDWIWNYFSYDRGLRLIIRPFSRVPQPVPEANPPAEPAPAVASPASAPGWNSNTPPAAGANPPA